MSVETHIYVYADTKEFGSPLFLGILNAAPVRGKEVFSFEYSKDWLENRRGFAIDPQLKLFEGRQFNAEEKPNFGIFTDSAPDRWGRVLMNRREALSAKIEDRKKKTLLESDYLLGVFDELRIGALRFKTDPRGNFLNDDKRLSAPPMASLRELQGVSLKIEDGENGASDALRLKWLNMLIAPGSSLGGARPKANVVAPDGSLWIAKFPSKSDSDDVEAWEMSANALAKILRLDVPKVDLKKFASKRHTFLTKRFDRVKNKRVHFASAMTLIGYSDGADAAAGASYLELAEFISRFGDLRDLREMWARIVFNICIGNSDDHLRNHGFLWDGDCWRLSPVYDITPNPDAAGLSLNITESDNALDLNLALEVAPFFKLTAREAKKTARDFAKTISARWRAIAADCAIPQPEQDRYASAFSAASEF